MQRLSRSKLAGFSLLSFMFFGGILACLLVIGAKAAPIYIEYFAIVKAATKAAAGSTVPEVRQIFDKASAIDDISSIGGKDLDVQKEGDKVVVRFAYNKEIALAGQAHLLFKFSGRSR